MEIEQKQNKVIKPTSVYTMAAEEQNQITTELQNLISEGGLTPSSSDLTQVKTAVHNIANDPSNSKANLSGGNSFSGTQTVSVPNGTDNIELFETTTNSHTAISQTPAGPVITSNSTNANIVFNDINLLKRCYTLSSFPATLASNTNYQATLNGSVSITLPTPTNTAFENVINILLNVTASSTIDWGINANVAMTTFSVGKYLIKLRYDNATSNWIGEVLKGESVASTTKAYFSFNDGYADETGNTTLTPYSGYTPEFDAEITNFQGRKSLKHIGQSYKYFEPTFASPLILSGAFNIKFLLYFPLGSYHNAILLGSPSEISTPILNVDDSSGSTRLNFYAPVAASGSTISSIFQNLNLGIYSQNAWHYIEISRDSNNSVYLFLDGALKNTTTYSGDIYLRPHSMFAGSTGNYYVQDFVIEAQVGHTSDYTVPTTPYSISEQSLSDYHDETKQNSLNNTQLSAVNSGIDTNKVTQISTNTTDISTINGKIPAQATSSNQLADKNFVNSSIATNTANFIGTFNSLADLQAYSGTVTNNDYAFVIDTDTAGNTLYERYKYNGTSWVFEYALNNSGFTAAQWAAINSGITAALVSLIGTALQSVPFATSSTIGGFKIEVDEVNHIANIITED